MTDSSPEHRPAELFGYAVDNVSNEASEARQNYWCRFLGTRCVKKSTHHLLQGKGTPFGVCSVWHREKSMDNPVPNLICPKRFLQDEVIFEDAKSILRGPIHELRVIEEVHIAGEKAPEDLGSVDWFVVNYDPQRKEIVDFYGLEGMAVSTTSTGRIVQAMLDALAGQSKQKYTYGINYRQVLSRMIVQLLVKGTAFQEWGKKYVWAIQDVLLRYMLRTYELTLNQGLDKTIGLVSYRVTSQNGYFGLSRDDALSGTLEDFAKLLRPSRGRMPELADIENELRQRITIGSAKDIEV